MECTCSSLGSPALTTVPSSLVRTAFLEKSVLNAQPLKLSNKKTFPLPGRLKFLHTRAQASSSTDHCSYWFWFIDSSVFLLTGTFDFLIILNSL